MLFDKCEIFEIGKVSADGFSGNANVFADFSMCERAVDSRALLGPLTLGAPLQQEHCQLRRSGKREPKNPELCASPLVLHTQQACGILAGDRVAQQKVEKSGAGESSELARVLGDGGYDVRTTRDRGREPKDFSRSGKSKRHPLALAGVHGEFHPSLQQEMDAKCFLFLGEDHRVRVA